MKLRDIVTHDDILILSLAGTLLLMGRHVAHVYDETGAWGIIAAVALSVATMQFLLRGRKLRGYFFAIDIITT